jgi:hypothetical protein
MAKKKQKVQLDARIDHDTYATLKTLATLDGRTTSNYVNKVLGDFVGGRLKPVVEEVGHGSTAV